MDAPQAIQVGDPAVAAQALSQQHGFREHVHRSVALPLETDGPPTGVDLAFWPTRRDEGLPDLPPPNFRCQRCGALIAPTAGWWCRDCDKIVWWLQQELGLSMVQIAHSGEYEPTWGELISDIAPWLIPDRWRLPVGPTLIEEQQRRIAKAQTPTGTGAKLQLSYVARAVGRKRRRAA